MARLTIRIPVLDRRKIAPMLAKALKVAAQRAPGIVAERTQRGLDVSGAPLKPYSSRYALLRQQAGRQTSPVNLTLTGQLLRNLRVLRQDSALRQVIGFEGQHRANVFSPAKGKQQRRTVRKTPGTVPMASVVLGLQRTRRFFGIEMPGEIAQLVAIVNRVLAEELAKQK